MYAKHFEWEEIEREREREQQQSIQAKRTRTIMRKVSVIAQVKGTQMEGTENGIQELYV